MKKILYPILLILISSAAFAQGGTFNVVTGKTEFADSLKLRKYGNSGALDSVLTVDPVTKKLKFIKNNGGAPVSYQGVDSVKYDTATKTMCVWSFGLANCFVITTNAPPVNTGVDSVVVNGSQLCTYTSGVATCYTVNTTINNNQYITNYIDSSITVINNPTCSPKVFSGSVVVDSLYVGRNTDIYFQINCVDYFAAASQFNIVSGGGSPFYVGIYADTAGNIGQVVGNTNPLEIPSLLDPQSQILLKVYYIDPTTTTPQGSSTTWVYREGNDAYWLDSAGTVTSSYDSVNTLNPFAGVHSLRISAMTAGQYFTWQDGATHTSTEFTDFSAQLRISAVLLKSVKWSITLYNGNSLATSNSVIITDGQYGYNRSAAGGYQFISFPMSQFNFISNTFDKVRITFLGTAAVAQQWDDVRFQADALPVNTGQFVESVRGVFGKNVEFAVGDTLLLDGDSANYLLKDKRTGATLATAASLLTYARYDTCFVIDTLDVRTFAISLNPYCISGGGGGSGTVTSVAKGYGIVADGTITTTGTVTVDSSVISSKAYVNAVGALKIDSLRRIGGSLNVQALKNGSWVTQYVDSASTGTIPLTLGWVGVGTGPTISGSNQFTYSNNLLRVVDNPSSMANPYETAVFEKDSDMKMGVYSSTQDSSGALSPAPTIGVAYTTGYTKLKMTGGSLPFFEMQHIFGRTKETNRMRWNFVTRDSTTGIVIPSGDTSLFNIYGDGKINIKTLSTDSTAVAQVGTVKMVTTDKNGRLSHQTIPTGGGGSGTSIYYNIKDYGADSTGVADATTSIRAARDAAVLAGGGTVYIPHGTYKLSDSIRVRTDNVVFMGEGESSKILATGDFGNIFHVQATVDPTTQTGGIRGSQFKDFYIESSTTRTSGAAIYLKYTYNAIVSNMRIGTCDWQGDNSVTMRMYDGVYFEYQSAAIVTGTQIYPTHYGVYFSGSRTPAVGGAVGLFYWDGLVTGNCNIWGKRNNGAFVSGSAGIYIAGGTGGVQVEQSNISFFENGIKTVGNNRELFIGHAFSADDCGGAGVYITGNLNVLQMTGGWTAGNSRSSAMSPRYNVYVDSTVTSTDARDLSAVPRINITGGTFYAGYNGMYLGTGRITLSGVNIYNDTALHLVLGGNVASASISGGRVLGLTNYSAISPKIRAVTGLEDTQNTDATTGSIPFASSSLWATDNSNLFWDNTNKRLGVGTNLPSEIINAKKNQTAATKILVENTNAGGGASSLIQAKTDLSTTEMGNLSSGYALSGIIQPNAGYVLSTSPSNMFIGTTVATAPLKFMTGFTEKMRLFANGSLGIGSTFVDSTTGKLVVIGNTQSTTYTGTTYTATTSVVSPVHAGGSATTSTLILQPTTGVGTTGADIIFKNGNNGATQAAIIKHSGSFGIGTTTPQGAFDVQNKFRVNTGSAAINELVAGTSIDTYSGESLIFIASPAVPGTKQVQFGSWNGSQWKSVMEWANTTGGTEATILIGKTSGRVAIGGTSATDKLEVTGNFALMTAGNKIKIATGTNASVGTATLVGGTVTVSTTAALTASKIFVTVVTPGGTQGFLSVPTITNATSFVINSTSGTETSTVNWWIIN